MLVRIVYASAAAVPFSTKELAELLRIARANNSRLGVGGLLLFHQGSFLQVLEGDPAVVAPLYEKIAADPRHDRVLLLGRFEVDSPAFGEWSMGSLELAGLTGPDREGLSDFLQGGTIGLHDDQLLVSRILNQFRDNRYRQYLR